MAITQMIGISQINTALMDLNLSGMLVLMFILLQMIKDFIKNFEMFTAHFENKRCIPVPNNLKSFSSTQSWILTLKTPKM